MILKFSLFTTIMSGAERKHHMDGLIIKEKWLDLILSGKKTLEIRGSNTTKINETIYLLESGTHRVRGTCAIKSTFPITCDDWYNNTNKHCVDIPYSKLRKRYDTPYAWVLKDIEHWDDVSYYEHPKGAVIWIKNVEPTDEMHDNERLRYGY